MQENFYQASYQEKRRDMIQSYLFRENANLDSLEDQIKNFQYQQVQNYPNIYLHERTYCKYNSHKKAQFLCKSQCCLKHAIICGIQNCQCAFDHRRCIFIPIEHYLDQIVKIMTQPIAKQVQLYFEVKSVIYEHMMNRVSEEQQALRNWQQDIQTASGKPIFLYGFNQSQPIVCHDPKVVYDQNPIQNHQKCGCFPLKINIKEVKAEKKEAIKKICDKVHKKYSTMINYFDEKIDKLWFNKERANLTQAQFLFVDFIQNKHGLCFNKGQKKMNIVPGRAIYQARQQRKRNQKNIDIQKLSLNRLRKIWKNYSEKIFRLHIEGKTMNNLFCRAEKAEHLKIQSVQEIVDQIDNIFKSFNEGQELMRKNILRKPKQFKNVEPEKLKKELQKYRGVKYDEIYIHNDRYQTAMTSIESAKMLSNFRNVTKLEIKWCFQMTAQESIEIINAMPQLKQLALLEYRSSKLWPQFVKKLCQLPQLKSFYTSHISHPQYHRTYYEDASFVQMNYLKTISLLQTEDLLSLSQLSTLQNIEINHVIKSTQQMIQNMKSLKHLTIQIVQDRYQQHNFNKLNDELDQLRTLRTLSLQNVRVFSQTVNLIISNNPHLNTIVIINREIKENINDQTIECMSNLIQLQNLCLVHVSITGQYLNKLKNLKMLQLVCSSKIIKVAMVIQALNNMRMLQHLDLRNNQWVDDQVIMSIKQCKRLTYLNIGYTSVSGQAFKHLKELNRLKILICYRTKISGSDLIELTKHVASITRLSISSLEISNSELLEIAKNCKEITHLEEVGTKITVKALLRIKTLKVLKTYKGEEDTWKFKGQGIQVYSR